MQVARFHQPAPLPRLRLKSLLVPKNLALVQPLGFHQRHQPECEVDLSSVFLRNLLQNLSREAVPDAVNVERGLLSLDQKPLAEEPVEVLLRSRHKFPLFYALFSCGKVDYIVLLGSVFLVQGCVNRVINRADHFRPAPLSPLPRLPLQFRVQNYRLERFDLYHFCLIQF